MKILLTTFLILGSLTTFAQSELETSNESNRASTQGYDGYANEGMEEQQEDIKFSGEMSDETSNQQSNFDDSYINEDEMNEYDEQY